MRTLDVCLAMRICGDNGISRDSLDARSHLCFSGRNLGALFEVPCVGLSIMNLKLFDAYRIINSRILAVTLEYLGDIMVLVDLCLKVLF